METLLVNLSTKARRETLYGREYLVAPMVLIVPGVLNGSQGDLYYPPSEVSKYPELWDNKPLVVNHPPGGAGDSSNLNRYQIGFLLNARVENGNLVADGWFDTARVSVVDNRILKSLLSGSKIELSTGLRVDYDRTAGVDPVGKGYVAIAKNYRPDHVAILPDTVGACSLSDGCGVLVNELKTLVTNLSQEDRELVMNVNNVTKKEGKEDLPSSAYAYVPDSNKPSTWKLRIDDKSHVAGAVAAIGKGFRGNKVSIPASDMAGVKKKIRSAWLKFNPDKSEKDLPPILTNERSEMTKDEIITDLISNCSCYEEGDRETLNNLSETKLQKLVDAAKEKKAAEAVVNAAKAGFDNGDGKTVWNEKTLQFEYVPKKKEPTKKGVTIPGGMEEGNQEVNNQSETVTKETVINHLKSLTPEEWFDVAPPGVQQVVKEADDVRNQERSNLIKVIVDNSEEATKESNKAIAEKLDMAALRAWSGSIKKVDNGNPFRRGDYSGQAPAVANSYGDGPKPEPMPSTDWNSFFATSRN